MPNKLEISLDFLHTELKKHKGPIYVYDKNKIKNNAKIFMNTFIEHIPNFKQYFAVKATSNVHIMELLRKEGMGFDCSSPYELELVKQLNGSNEVIYSSNYTSVEDFEYLLENINLQNVNIKINLDDTDGLENLIQASKNIQVLLPEFISFRLNPLFGSTNSETKSNVLGGSDTKFGIPEDRIVEAYKRAKDAGFTKFGIHVMTGSCVLDVNYFSELVDVLFKYINKICKELDITFEFIDLGGGIGIPYKPNQRAIDVELLAKTISERIQYNMNLYDLPSNFVIAMENGRYITGPYGWLVAQCKSIKNGVNGKKFYGLNACMANLMRPGMYNAYHHIFVPRLDDNENQSNNRENVNVVGTLCENNDWFAKNRSLPVNINKDDIFVICDAGAHGFTMGFQYNGKTRSAELLYDSINHTMQVIRERERTCFY